MENELNSWVSIVSNKISQIDLMEDQIKEDKKKLTLLTDEISDTEQARTILQEIAKNVQEEAHKKIASVVTKALSIVFPDPYEFKINFLSKRGKTEAQLVFVRNGVEFPPLQATGGGAVDVAAFALRLSCLMINTPKLSRVLIMDEPFKYVSVHYQDKVREMLEMLSEHLGVQFIFVTHIEKLKTGNVIEL